MLTSQEANSTGSPMCGCPEAFEGSTGALMHVMRRHEWSKQAIDQLVTHHGWETVSQACQLFDMPVTWQCQHGRTYTTAIAMNDQAVTKTVKAAVDGDIALTRLMLQHTEPELEEVLRILVRDHDVANWPDNRRADFERLFNDSARFNTKERHIRQRAMRRAMRRHQR